MPGPVSRFKPQPREHVQPTTSDDRSEGTPLLLEMGFEQGYAARKEITVDEAASDERPAPVVTKVKTPWWSYIWDYDPGRSDEEVRFIRKLDLFLVTMLSFGYFIKNLDQTNISNAFVSGIVALSLNYAAFYAEIFKAGISSIDRGQWEASWAMGMRDRTVMARIILPQAVRRMLPPVGNMIVSLTKDTSLVSAIGVAELMNASQTVGAQTFRNLEALLVAAVFYLIINIPLSILVSWLHRKQMRDA